MCLSRIREAETWEEEQAIREAEAWEEEQAIREVTTRPNRSVRIPSSVSTRICVLRG